MFCTNVWQRMKDLMPQAYVVERTPNMKISRRHLADYVKTLHRKACRTCSMIVFPHSTNQIIDLSRCRYCRRRHFLMNSLFFLSLEPIFQFYFSRGTPFLKVERRISQIQYTSKFTMKLVNPLQYDGPGQTVMQGGIFTILAQQNLDANCKLEKASCDSILKPILGLCLPARLAIGCPLLPQFEFSLFCLIDKTKDN